MSAYPMRGGADIFEELGEFRATLVGEATPVGVRSA
jgi:hypothetical protein